MIVKFEEYCDTDLIARVLPDRLVAKSMPEWRIEFADNVSPNRKGEVPLPAARWQRWESPQKGRATPCE